MPASGPFGRSVRCSTAVTRRRRQRPMAGRARPTVHALRQPVSGPVVVAAGLRDVPAGARSDRGGVDVVATDGPYGPGRGQRRSHRLGGVAARQRGELLDHDIWSGVQHRGGGGVAVQHVGDEGLSAEFGE